MKTQSSIMRELQLSEIVEAVISSFLNTTAERVEDTGFCTLAEESSWTGCVSIDGTWRGAITIACGDSLLRWAATQILSQRGITVADSEARDVLGEIANIVAGNFKSLFFDKDQAPCVMSLPIVARGSLRIPNTQQTHRLCFQCGAEVLVVTVLRMVPGDGGDTGLALKDTCDEGPGR